MMATLASRPGGKKMLKERLELANHVAVQLSEVEAAIDNAIAKAGTLMATLPAAQTAAKLSPVVGDTTFGHLGAAVAALYDGRSRMVAVHHELDSVKNHLGLRNFKVVGTGDAGKILPATARNDAIGDADEAAAA